MRGLTWVRPRRNVDVDLLGHGRAVGGQVESASGGGLRLRCLSVVEVRDGACGAPAGSSSILGKARFGVRRYRKWGIPLRWNSHTHFWG